MFNAITDIFGRGPGPSKSSSLQRSAAIDAQIVADRSALRSTLHVLVLGPAGGGKSSLLRLLAGAQSAPPPVQDIGDGEDFRSTVSSLTLTPSGDDEADGQQVEREAKGDDNLPARGVGSPINEIMVQDRNGRLHLHISEVPSTISRKVMHQFHHGTKNAIVYPVDLSSYTDAAPDTPPASLTSCPATTPAPTCQLQASLDALGGYLRSELWYRTYPLVIVLLTNPDRLAEKLQVTPFGGVFPEFNGEETLGCVAEYVLRLCKQMNVNNELGTRIHCVYPAVLNLAEEDEVKRAVTRAGVLAFVTEIILIANLVIISCFGSSSISDDKETISDAILEEVRQGAWDGTVLRGWELWQ
jgi:hypothetical protein